MSQIEARVGLQQRVLPAYRAAFFDALAGECAGGLSVFAGQPQRNEALGEEGKLSTAHYASARNRHIFKSRFYLCWQSGIRRWLAEWHPDVLIVEANSRYLSTPTAVRWMHARNRKVIGWGLGAPSLSGPLQGVKINLRKSFLGQFDAMITYSQKGAREYRDIGFSVEQIFVAANAAAPRPQHDLPEREPSYTREGALVLFVGRLQARKRIDLLLRACAELAEDKAPRLLIVGDGPERAALESLAAQIYPRAQFTGDLRGEKLARTFRTADLFVLPGTGGLAVQEAMSYGLPVIVAEADGTQIDLVRPTNGWILPPGDQHTLTTILQDALAHPARLRQMGAESYRIVSEEINLQQMVAVFAQAIHFALTG